MISFDFSQVIVMIIGSYYLSLGQLQLADGTSIIVDETILNEGVFNNTGTNRMEYELSYK
jgi:hypothetical protein